MACGELLDRPQVEYLRTFVDQLCRLRWRELRDVAPIDTSVQQHEPRAHSGSDEGEICRLRKKIHSSPCQVRFNEAMVRLLCIEGVQINYMFFNDDASRNDARNTRIAKRKEAL